MEVLVALVITATALVVLAGTMYSAFGSIGFSRQRDTATELANQTMEQIKALTFNDLVMSVADVNTDTLVSCSGSCSFGSRTIPTVSSGSLPPAPLYPHTTTTTPAVGSSSGPSTYTISSYITFDATGNTQARVATVRVVWNHPVVGASALVQIESTIFASGPVAAGSGHAWSAQAVDSPGTVSISAGTLLTGTLASLNFGPGSASASVGVNGTAAAAGNVAASSLQLLGQSLLQTATSSSSASSATGQGVSAPSATTVNNSGALGPVSSLLGLDTAALGITGGVGVTATTQAVAASSANGTANLSGATMPNSSLPYAQGLAQQSGPISLGLNLALLNLLGLQIGSTNVTLLNITPLGNSNPDLATVCQQATSGAGCQGAMPATGNTTGVSQALPAGAAIVAQAQKSFSRITVLPTLATPLLDIQGFTAAASAQAGPGITNSGKANATALSVNLLGIPISLSSLLSGVASTVTNVGTVLGTLGVQVSLKLGAATTTGNSAFVSSPITLTISLSLLSLVNINVTVNLGTVSASASYS
ncbi:MAG TPA: hypothetical protein VHT75_15925 [Acidimicrobiales bacterium]|nr:hypothetical protein [Acidimicrobiales bacterium]